MPRHYASLAGGIAALLAVAAPAVAAAPAVDLLSHRAAYRLSLAKADSGSGLAQVRGGLVLEWRADCDGWLSQQRLGFVAESDDGPGFTYDVRFSSWESLRQHPAALQRSLLRRPEAAGGVSRPRQARRRPAARARRATACPDGEDVALPAGTIFPTEHVADLIAAARAGERVLSREVFDGSGEDALTRATAVIGARKAIRLARGRRRGAALAGRASPISPRTATTCCRSSRSRSTCRRAACCSNVRLDYGEFTLKADLEKLETFARPDCR